MPRSRSATVAVAPAAVGAVLAGCGSSVTPASSGSGDVVERAWNNPEPVQPDALTASANDAHAFFEIPSATPQTWDRRLVAAVLPAPTS